MSDDFFPPDSPIQSLPPDVVNLMAAGEVIDSPAAAVRELIENALDADAMRLTIHIDLRHWWLRVADNGAGLTQSDLAQAALPHTTSKIRDRADLANVTSLGFRGEALHSLAQLAQLTVCSRVDDLGWQVDYDAHGSPRQVTTTALAPGTVVTIADLFGTWPARRAALPPVTRQLRDIQQVITRFALCHPRVTWQVYQADRLWFAIAPGTTATAILPQVLRQVTSGDLHSDTTVLPAPLRSQPLDLEVVSPDPAGTIAAPLTVPLDKDEEATTDGETAWTDGDQPLAAIAATDAAPSLAATPAGLDLTIGLPDRCHRRRPDWMVIALNGRPVQSPELEQAILQGFHRTLPRDRYPVCVLHLRIPPQYIDWNRHPAKTELYLHHVTHWQQQVIQAIAQAFQRSADRFADAPRDQAATVLTAAEATGVYQTSRQIAGSIEPGLGELRAIAQVHNLYILAEHPSGLWLIEQHIAHERVIYEQLRDRWQLVELSPPLRLTGLRSAQVEQLERIGLEVVPFGEQTWAIRTAPAPLAARADCAEALMELSLGGDLDAAIVATACRTAIRNGTPLTQSEMQHLLDQWQRTQQPRTCPHGRPIYLSLAESSLSRFFRRHWVIGKSHGI